MGTAVRPLDPQLYLPHADHARLVSHAYWPADYESGGFWTGPAVGYLLRELRRMNDELECTRFILPGVHAETLDDHWLTRQRVANAGRRPGEPLVYPKREAVALASADGGNTMTTGIFSPAH